MTPFRHYNVTNFLLSRENTPTENPRVGGSIPPQATSKPFDNTRGFWFSDYLLVYIEKLDEISYYNLLIVEEPLEVII
jgi:hypothetical protein